MAPFDDIEPRSACRVEGQFLDAQLFDNYLSPDQTVRGWVLYQLAEQKYLPGAVDFTITDTAGKSYKYSVDVPTKGDPNTDVLPRHLRATVLQDVSACQTELPQ